MVLERSHVLFCPCLRAFIMQTRETTQTALVPYVTAFRTQIRFYREDIVEESDENTTIETSRFPDVNKTR